MHRNIVIISLILMSLAQIVNSQNSDSYSHKELEIKLKADEHYINHNYYLALPLYQQLDTLMPEVDYSYEIAVCLFHTRHWEAAEDLFVTMIDSTDKFPEELNFYWAVLMHYDENLDSAKIYYQKYLDDLSPIKKHYDAIYTDIRHRMELCDRGLELMKNPRDISIVNLGDHVNSEYPDYGPVWSSGKLYYTSERPVHKGEDVDLSDGTYTDNVYVIDHPEDDKWLNSRRVKGEFFHDGSNESCIDISSNGEKMLVYCNSEKGFLGLNSGNIYETKLKEDSCFDFDKLPREINSRHWESGASYTNSGLVFSSDRKSGKGGSDLYIIEKDENGNWGDAKNLGALINTPYNEDSPFITPDGMYLIFASQGHNSIGGYDLFYSKKNSDGNWGEPVNVGYPINSAHDEMYFSLSKDLKSFYLSSDRKGGVGDVDIYYIRLQDGSLVEFE